MTAAEVKASSEHAIATVQRSMAATSKAFYGGQRSTVLVFSWVFVLFVLFYVIAKFELWLLIEILLAVVLAVWLVALGISSYMVSRQEARRALWSAEGGTELPGPRDWTPAP